MRGTPIGLPSKSRHIGAIFVAEPKRHASGLGDLTDREAAALGLLVNGLARALKEVAGAEHVYSFVFGDGLAHQHVVLAPRYAGTPRGILGCPTPGVARGSLRWRR